MEGHAVIEGNLKKQVSLRILPKKMPPTHLLQFHLPCTTYLLNELLQAWQKPHFLWTVRRSSKSITMTPNNSIQMSKFRSSGDMSLVKGYLHTNKMFDTIHAQDFVDRLSCLSAAAAADAACVWSLGHRWSIIVSWIKIPVRLFFFAFFPSLYVLFGSIDVYVFLRF